MNIDFISYLSTRLDNPDLATENWIWKKHLEKEFVNCFSSVTEFYTTKINLEPEQSFNILDIDGDLSKIKDEAYIFEIYINPEDTFEIIQREVIDCFNKFKEEDDASMLYVYLSDYPEKFTFQITNLEHNLSGYILIRE